MTTDENEGLQMDGEPEDLIRNELAAGERLLWTGRPRQGIVLRPADIFFISFSLMWGGFAIFWEVGVLASGAPWFMSIWGIPLVLIGLYIIFGRFLVDARQRASKFYAVTSERVLIVSGVFAQKVRSLDLDAIGDVSLTERRNGAGTITLSQVPHYWWSSGMEWPGLASLDIPRFELAGEARQVYEIIRSARRAAKSQV
jgi:hypothetical protein